MTPYHQPGPKYHDFMNYCRSLLIELIVSTYASLHSTHSLLKHKLVSLLYSEIPNDLHLMQNKEKSLLYVKSHEFTNPHSPFFCVLSPFLTNLPLYSLRQSQRLPFPFLDMPELLYAQTFCTWCSLNPECFLLIYLPGLFFSCQSPSQQELHWPPLLPTDIIDSLLLFWFLLFITIYYL